MFAVAALLAGWLGLRGQNAELEARLGQTGGAPGAQLDPEDHDERATR